MMVSVPWGYVCGAVTYRCCLHICMVAMGSWPFLGGLSSAQTIASNIFGAFTVGLSTALAHEVYFYVHHKQHGRWGVKQAIPSRGNGYLQAAAGLPVFLCLRALSCRGRNLSYIVNFRCVAMSDLWHPGSYAVSSISGTTPVRPGIYVQGSRASAEIVRLGNTYGCHSCGSRHVFSSRTKAWLNKLRLRRWLGISTRRRDFNGDHQPPSGLLPGTKQKPKQILLPQCTECSQLQSVSVRSKRRTLVGHSFVAGTRLWHLWIPLPLPLN